MNKRFYNRPLKLILRGSTYYIHGTRNGRRVRVATNANNLGQAKIALLDLESEFESGWRNQESGADVSWKAVAKWICDRHRVSAKERGIPFQIETFDVFCEMQRSNFRCAISGIPLSRRVGPNVAEPDPWSASLDRIENRQGYVKDNFRVVCLAANIAMNRWGYDVLLFLARSMVRSSEQVLCADFVRTPSTEKQIQQ